MKKQVLNLLLSLATCAGLQAQTIWTGPKMTFSKAANADWTLEANQDRITSNVWITRANSQGIFNIKTETGYTSNSPVDTEWAMGSTANLSGLTFDTWKNTVGNPGSAVNQDMVVHLITDDIYIDIKFLSWAGGNGGGSGGSGGGAFSYERSTASIGIDEAEAKSAIKLYPNPTTGLVKVDIDSREVIKIYDLRGKEILTTELEPNESLDISRLHNGVYIFSIVGKGQLKFTKE